LYREIKLNGENVSYISPCFNPLNPLLRFAIKLGRETQPCQHEALCVVGNVNQSHFACWFISFIIWISKPVSLGHSTSYPVMFMIVDSMCARVLSVCVHVRFYGLFV